MTTVINLLGGSGSGKSTLSHALVYALKMRGCRVESVQEFVKGLAWEGTQLHKYSQPVIFGEQCRRESSLYEKVEFIVTDSPLLLIPFYEQRILGEVVIGDGVFNFIKFSEKNGITYLNFWLDRPNFFDTHGRYQNKEEAKQLDVDLQKWLVDKQINVTHLPPDDTVRIKQILKAINQYEKPHVD